MIVWSRYRPCYSNYIYGNPNMDILPSHPDLVGGRSNWYTRITENIYSNGSWIRSVTGMITSSLIVFRRWGWLRWMRWLLQTVYWFQSNAKSCPGRFGVDWNGRLALWKKNLNWHLKWRGSSYLCLINASGWQKPGRSNELRTSSQDYIYETIVHRNSKNRWGSQCP